MGGTRRVYFLFTALFPGIKFDWNIVEKNQISIAEFWCISLFSKSQRTIVWCLRKGRCEIRHYIWTIT